MKAIKRKIINHIKAGKPFLYNGWRYSNENNRDIMTLEPFEKSSADLLREDECFHLISSVIRISDGKLIPIDTASMRIKPGGTLVVLLTCGSINAEVSLKHENFVLLDKDYKPLNK